MKFENKNLIVKEGNETLQVDEFEQLLEKFFGKEYLGKNENDKMKDRYEKMYPYSLVKNKRIYINPKMEVVRGKINKVEDDIDVKNSLFIGNEISFFASLCQINQLQILEEKNSNIFTAGIDKSNMNGNYVLVNLFATKILEELLKHDL